MSERKYSSFQELKELQKQENKMLERQNGQHANIARRITDGDDGMPRFVGGSAGSHGVRTWNHLDLIAIGNWLKQSRKEAGMTQDQMARKLQTDVGTISRIETGKLGTLNRANLNAFCFYIGINPDKFIEELENKPAMMAVGASNLKRRQSHKEEFEGDDFTLTVDIGFDDFTFTMLRNGMETEIYKGRKIKNHSFFEAMREGIKSIEKSF